MINIKKTSNLFASLLLIVCCTTLSCATGKPELQLKTQQYDLGNLDSEHRVQTIHAPFTNKGGGELIIKDIKTDCDCTTVQYPKEAAYKHRSGDEIKITVDLTPFFPGPILKKVAIYTNGQPQPVVITIKGHVI